LVTLSRCHISARELSKDSGNEPHILLPRKLSSGGSQCQCYHSERRLSGPGRSLRLWEESLLRCLTGLIPHAPQGEMLGRLEICGLDTRTQPLAKLVTAVNMVFQDPEIGFFCSTVEDEVAFGPRNLGLSSREVQERVEFALEGTHIVACDSCSELIFDQRETTKEGRTLCRSCNFGACYEN